MLSQRQSTKTDLATKQRVPQQAQTTLLKDKYVKLNTGPVKIDAVTEAEHKN